MLGLLQFDNDSFAVIANMLIELKFTLSKPFKLPPLADNTISAFKLSKLDNPEKSFRASLPDIQNPPFNVFKFPNQFKSLKLVLLICNNPLIDSNCPKGTI